MEEITICVYNNGSRGKKVARRNGKRITITDANKLVIDKLPVKIITRIGYTELFYEI